jgi:hypothetical protein
VSVRDEAETVEISPRSSRAYHSFLRGILIAHRQAASKSNTQSGHSVERSALASLAGSHSRRASIWTDEKAHVNSSLHTSDLCFVYVLCLRAFAHVCVGKLKKKKYVRLSLRAGRRKRREGKEST